MAPAPRSATPSPPAPLTLVLGEEPLLRERAVSRVIAGVRAHMDPEQANDLPIEKLRAGDLTAAEVAELLSPSLFAEEKVIVFHSAAEAGKEPAAVLTELSASLAPGTYVVVEHSGGGRAKALVPALKKAGADVVECPKITRRSERIAFVREEFRAAGQRADADTVEALLVAVGEDIRELASAISQLVSDVDGPVTAREVRQYYAGVAAITGFSIADRALAGDAAGAVEFLRWSLATGTHAVPIADALGDAVATIGIVASAQGARQGAGTLRMPPWKMKKAQQDARRWSPDRLARAMVVCERVNGEVKGGAADASYALERAVREVALLARGRDRA